MPETIGDTKRDLTVHMAKFRNEVLGADPVVSAPSGNPGSEASITLATARQSC